MHHKLWGVDYYEISPLPLGLSYICRRVHQLHSVLLDIRASIFGMKFVLAMLRSDMQDASLLGRCWLLFATFVCTGQALFCTEYLQHDLGTRWTQISASEANQSSIYSKFREIEAVQFQRKVVYSKICYELDGSPFALESKCMQSWLPSRFWVTVERGFEIYCFLSSLQVWGGAPGEKKFGTTDATASFSYSKLIRNIWYDKYLWSPATSMSRSLYLNLLLNCWILFLWFAYFRTPHNLLLGYIVKLHTFK